MNRTGLSEPNSRRPPQAITAAACVLIARTRFGNPLRPSFRTVCLIYEPHAAGLGIKPMRQKLRFKSGSAPPRPRRDRRNLGLFGPGICWGILIE
jgi:hypothetical protein